MRKKGDVRFQRVKDSSETDEEDDGAAAPTASPAADVEAGESAESKLSDDLARSAATAYPREVELGEVGQHQRHEAEQQQQRRQQHPPRAGSAPSERTHGANGASRAPLAGAGSAPLAPASCCRCAGADTETLILDPSPELEPSQLERKWQQMGGNSTLWGFSLARVPGPGELEAALASHNVMCLASGELDNLLKYYFFAQQVGARFPPAPRRAPHPLTLLGPAPALLQHRTDTLFLIEVSVSKQTAHMTAVLKGDRADLVPQLRGIVHRALAPLGMP